MTSRGNEFSFTQNNYPQGYEVDRYCRVMLLRAKIGSALRCKKSLRPLLPGIIWGQYTLSSCVLSQAEFTYEVVLAKVCTWIECPILVESWFSVS